MTHRIGTTVNFHYSHTGETLTGEIKNIFRAAKVNGVQLPVRYAIETAGGIYSGIPESDICPMR